MIVVITEDGSEHHTKKVRHMEKRMSDEII